MARVPPCLVSRNQRSVGLNYEALGTNLSHRPERSIMNFKAKKRSRSSVPYKINIAPPSTVTFSIIVSLFRGNFLFSQVGVSFSRNADRSRWPLPLDILWDVSWSVMNRLAASEVDSNHAASPPSVETELCRVVPPLRGYLSSNRCCIPKKPRSHCATNRKSSVGLHAAALTERARPPSKNLTAGYAGPLIGLDAARGAEKSIVKHDFHVSLSATLCCLQWRASLMND